MGSLPCSISSNGVQLRDCKTEFSQQRLELLLSPELSFLLTSIIPPNAVFSFVCNWYDRGNNDGDFGDGCAGDDGFGNNVLLEFRTGKDVGRGSLSGC